MFIVFFSLNVNNFAETQKNIVFTIEELQSLGASTVDESLNLIQSSIKSDSEISSKKSVFYKGSRIENVNEEDISNIFKSLKLDKIDHIEVSKNGNEVKYHLSKSLTKEGITALFSFSLLEEKDEDPFNPKIITGTKSLISSKKLASPVRVISNQELSMMGAVSVKEALEKVASLTISDSGGVQTLFYRGFSDGNTKVLYNGVDLSDPSGISGSPIFSHIPVEDVERIEILSGSNSILYGTGAVAGVINIISNKKNHLSYSTKVGPSQYVSSISTGKSFGLTSFFLVGSKSFNNSLSMFTNTEEKDAFLNEHVTFGFSHQLKNGVIDAFYTKNEASNQLDTEVYGPAPDFKKNFVDDSNSESSLSQGIAKVTYKFSDSSSVGNQINWTRSNIVRRYYNQEDSAENSATADNQYRGTVDTVDIIKHLQLEKNKMLVFGLEGRQESSKNSGTFNGFKTESPLQKRRSIGFFSQYFADYKWVSTELGGRLEEYSSGFSDTYNASVFRNIPFVNVEIKGTYKTGFKLPSLYQLTSLIGDPNLEAENSETTDVGFSKEYKYVKLGSSFFKSNITNQIAYDFSTNTYQNIKKSVFSGQEFRIEVKKYEILDFFTVEYTKMKSNNIKVPEYKAVVSTGLKWGKLGYGLFITSVGENELTKKAYSITDTSIHYEFNNKTNSFIKVHNVFNESYVLVSNYATPGQTLFFGLNHSF